MKKIKFCGLIGLALVALIACEGRTDDGYDNAGLSEAEQTHTRALIDSSLVNLKRDFKVADSITHEELRKEIVLLKEEIASLKKKK